jgi:large subunit ribosomal protein L3
MGAKRRTVQNLEVFGVDADRGLILVKGGVPGAKGSFVRVTDAVKRSLPASAPYPAGIIKSGETVEATPSEISESEA